MNFCRLRPSRSQTAGTRESRAVMPGMSPTAPRSPSATNQPKERPQIISTMGSKATLAADRMSETTETLRRLKRSVSARADKADDELGCGTDEREGASGQGVAGGGEEHKR